MKKIISFALALLVSGNLLAVCFQITPLAQAASGESEYSQFVGELVLNNSACVYSGEAELSSEYQSKDNVVSLAQGGAAEWAVNVPEAGFYRIGIEYYAENSSSTGDIEIALLVGKEVRSCYLKKAWELGGPVTQDSNQNDLRPAVAQKEMWLTADLQSNGFALFYFEAGEQMIQITSLKDAFAISEVKIYNLPPPSPYIAPAGTDYNGEQLVWQAEEGFISSDPMIYPMADRTSPATQPSSPTKIRYNSIGGKNWSKAGQWITYTVDVPKDGLYELGFRFKQNAIRGLFTSRQIYIDGTVPFSELTHVRFPYSTQWQTLPLGGETPYLFSLPEGRHEITLEVTLGELEEVLGEVTGALTLLNEIYRSIIMVTGTQPDLLNDYQLEKQIPNLLSDIEAASQTLTAQAKALDGMVGAQGSESAMLHQIANQLNSFVKKPSTIPERIVDFRDNLSALGAWILNIKEQPLQLDFLYLKSPQKKFILENDSALSKIAFEIQALIGSFFEDYTSVGVNQSSTESIRVWVGTGRDQAGVIKQLADQSFSPKTGVSVNLSLVQGTLVQAVLAADSPDVVLNVGRGDPVNLALRGGIEPLDGYDTFADVKARFSPDETVPYQLNGKCYAIPETKNFFMMFYRKDIFAELGIEPARTWEDFYKIIPVIHRANMQIGLPYTNIDAFSIVSTGLGSQNIFTSLLYQNGGQYYSPDHTKTMLDTPEAISAFKQWTDLYTKYSFPLYFDFYNRFRTGEMPLGIQLYTLHNMFTMGAPEIDGLWDMCAIPGTIMPDGRVNRAEGSTGTAAIMLANSKSKQSAWKFLDWWSSAEVQANYGRELETMMGAAARYNPANLEAFGSIPWSQQQSRLILEQWEEVVELPEIAGGYYLSRNIDNAFKTVILNGANPREELFRWNNETNTEITRKRKEFKDAYAQ